jgi:hypothetical protein
MIAFIDGMLSYVGAPHGHLMAPPVGFQHKGILGVTLTGGQFTVIETVLLLFLECLPSVTSQFAARKICHSVSGLLFMTLDSATPDGRGAMFLIGMSSILMTWNITLAVGIKPFRFGATKDIGITVYLILVMLWFFGELPPVALSPMFFADPAGAVIGKWLTRNYPKENKAWYQKRTVGGSAAVFAFTLMTLIVFYPPMSSALRLALCILAVFGEALGGSYDNLLLSASVIGGYCLMAGSA